MCRRFSAIRILKYICSYNYDLTVVMLCVLHTTVSMNSFIDGIFSACCIRSFIIVNVSSPVVQYPSDGQNRLFVLHSRISDDNIKCTESILK